MKNLFIPTDYVSSLNILQTEQAIKDLRTFFEDELSAALNLHRASAPLFVAPESGLNDDLNGIERPVSFDCKELNLRGEIIQSLAKWKRFALGKYGFKPGVGIYTNMNAIRPDEITDNMHSLYVDQWDWELVIHKENRTENTLKDTVCKIYEVLKKCEKFICYKNSYIEPLLPENIHFVTTQEMENEYPHLTAAERENEYARKYKALFIMQIGANLKSGKPHDGRAADYDDWMLNGDIILYYPLFDKAFEISSMGIRVDENSLLKQIKERGHEYKLDMPFHKSILSAKLPYTIGGGIGQSRLCMYMLRKAHIGEVQVSLWPDGIEKACNDAGIHLL